MAGAALQHLKSVVRRELRWPDFVCDEVATVSAHASSLASNGNTVDQRICERARQRTEMCCSRSREAL
jgi:hypothetical protein